MSGLRFGILHELEVRGRSQDAERTMFANVVEQARLADELGFESCWFVEHHFTRGFSHSSAPDLVLAAISQVTRRIRTKVFINVVKKGGTVFVEGR